MVPSCPRIVNPLPFKGMMTHRQPQPGARGAPAPLDFASPESGAARLARPGLLLAGLVFLAIAASISGISNQFAQDDFAVILKNPAVHDLAHGYRFFAEPYWPKPFAPDLYRPLALLTFAIQWVIGSGGPLIFRIVSYLLYAITCLAMYRVARLALAPAAAFAVAALFAVHPVHVEAVAMAVNQGELWVTLLSCLAVHRYVTSRRTDGQTGSDIAVIGGLYLVSCFFKENGIVLPGLIAAAELFLVPGDISLGRRIRASLPVMITLLVLAVGFLAVRTAVLGGDVRGTQIAEAINLLGIGGRALTMLTVVPHWFRLLLWPAHLQGDYSPAEIVGQTSWAPGATVGLLLLVGVVLAGVMARHRAPAISFGLLWCAVALFPVHNVLVPTGIVLAERTLMLPSVGAMIVLGGVAELLLRQPRRSTAPGLAVITGILLILGVYRSTTRHPVWSDQFNYWFVTANTDAPLSYRAHHALAEMYVMAGVDGRAEREYQLSIALAPPGVSTVFLDYANRLRLKGFCYPAVRLYRRSLEVAPENMAVRASLAACLINIGDYNGALAETGRGIASGKKQELWNFLKATADSALRVQAPAGSIRITTPVDTTDADTIPNQ